MAPKGVGGVALMYSSAHSLSYRAIDCVGACLSEAGSWTGRSACMAWQATSPASYSRPSCLAWVRRTDQARALPSLRPQGSRGSAAVKALMFATGLQEHINATVTPNSAFGWRGACFFSTI